MLCSEFKKPGGGKGRPGRNMRCQGCGVTWESHGVAQKKTTGIARRRSQEEIAARIMEIEIESEAASKITEAPSKPMIRKPLGLPVPETKEFEPIKIEILDGATSILTSEDVDQINEPDLEIENIPMEQVKKESIKAKLDLYSIAAGIFR